jgi:hypothetical protein
VWAFRVNKLLDFHSIDFEVFFNFVNFDTYDIRAIDLVSPRRAVASPLLLLEALFIQNHIRVLVAVGTSLEQGSGSPER